ARESGMHQMRAHRRSRRMRGPASPAEKPRGQSRGFPPAAGTGGPIWHLRRLQRRTNYGLSGRLLLDELLDRIERALTIGELGAELVGRRQILEQRHLDVAATAAVPIDQPLLHVERVGTVDRALDDQRRRQLDRL